MFVRKFTCTDILIFQIILLWKVKAIAAKKNVDFASGLGCYRLFFKPVPVSVQNMRISRVKHFTVWI